MSKPTPVSADGSRPRRQRIWEIDFLRGAAIILMVLYHLGYDLKELAGVNSLLWIRIDLSNPVLVAAQYFFAGVFIVLSGISSTLSRSNVRRALKLVAVALVITAVTYAYNPSEVIVFGVLHFLAVSILVYGLAFEKTRAWTCAGAALLVAALSLAVPPAARSLGLETDWLLPFGVTSGNFSSYDYFPLLPWFSVFLVGAVLGKAVYVRKVSLIPRPPGETFINATGRHSLLIYVVHQPILIGLLYILGLLR
jgi:uncharacterized membrane protein